MKIDFKGKSFRFAFAAGVVRVAVLSLAMTVVHNGHAQEQAIPAASAAKPAPPTSVGGFFAPTKLPNAQPKAEAEPATPQKPGGEGITVHGHRVIDVKNPDGTLARHVEFENSLVPEQGDLLLTSLLTGAVVAGDWGIEASDTPNSLCGTGLTCLMVGSTTGPIGSAGCRSGTLVVCFSGLSTLFLPTGSGSSAGLHLQGNFTVVNTTSISSVLTLLGTCASTTTGSLFSATPIGTSPAQCAASTQSAPATGDTLLALSFTGVSPTPIPVTAGQVVTVGVTIRFS
jgi:hypothetical protein